MSNNEYILRRLLEVYPPHTLGTWRILGEDPNCDFGGGHHEPELETVTGTYVNVVKYAVTLPNFYTWGGGGRIIKLPSNLKNVDNIVNNPRVKELEDERIKLQDRMKEIEKELKGIG